MRKNSWISIRIDSLLRERVEVMAKQERRSLADQVAYLIEKGLKVLEQRELTESSPVQTGKTA